MKNCRYEKLERLLSNRGYIDYLLLENENVKDDTKELRADIRSVVNTCILNAMELVGLDHEEIQRMDNLLM